MNSKLNQMYPKSGEVFLRVKNLFSNEDKPIYQVSASIFGNYIDINVIDITFDDICNMQFIVCSDNYSVYRIFI